MFSCDVNKKADMTRCVFTELSGSIHWIFCAKIVRVDRDSWGKKAKQIDMLFN